MCDQYLINIYLVDLQDVDQNITRTHIG